MTGTPSPRQPAVAGEPFVPTADDMEATYEGVLVAGFFEDEGAIALTGDTNVALKAFAAYYSHFVGEPFFPEVLAVPDTTLDDLARYTESGYALFTRTEDGGWHVTRHDEPTAPHAVPATWLPDHDPLPDPEPTSPGQLTLPWGADA
ncbi:hypothetical protein ACFY2W_36080 [Streptomyces sp. NPDC001262]|uniref:hypothetical protein n=1 Tax=Streptomyces sp. NPDC001262 TaxID=3364552 RepID=UPI0036B03910